MVCVLSLPAVEDQTDVAWYDSLMKYQLQILFDIILHDRIENELERRSGIFKFAV
jgi:hypothetical protein